MSVERVPRARVGGAAGRTTTKRSAGSWSLLPWLVLGAAGIGVLAAFSPEAALGTVLVATVALLFVNSEYKTEIVVGFYWLSFCVYETVVSTLSITGFFYPFYAAFVVGLVATVVGRGITVNRGLFWLLVGYLVVMAVSFVGFLEPIDFAVVQRVLACLIAVLVYLQFRSRGGLTIVTGAAVLTSLVLAAWVVISAIQGGFAYRGDVNVNENVVAFYIGLGFVIAVCYGVQAFGATRRVGNAVMMLLVTGVLAYSLLLLASRGMVIAAGIALAALILRLVLQDPRKLLLVLALLAISAAGMLLPGGEGLVQRFTGERVESGGSRTPIWRAVYDAYRDGDVKELLLGNGFDSSQKVVSRGFGNLTSTHNAYLEVLYEFGLVGISLFLALHLAAIVVSWRIRGALGLVMYSLVFFLLGANITSTAPDGFLYWTALALALAVGTWGRTAPGGPAALDDPAPA